MPALTRIDRIRAGLDLRRTVRVAASGRLFWGVFDQGLFAATSFALSVAVANRASAAEFGAFGIAYVIYTLALGAVEAFTAEVVVVRGSHLPVAERRAMLAGASGTAVCFGLVGSAVGVAFLLLGSGTWSAIVPPLFIPAPLLFIQDVWRFGFFAGDRPRAAALNDLTWAILLALGFSLVLLSGHGTSTNLLWCWSGAGAVCGALGLLQSRCIPRPDLLAEWVRKQTRAGGRFAGEYLALYGAGQSVLIWIGLFDGLAASAGYRGATLLFGPIQVFLNAVRLAVTPIVVRAHRAGRSNSALRGGATIGVSAALLAVVWGLFLLALPESIGHHILGSSWTSTRPVLPLMLWITAVQAAGLGAVVLLRVIGAYRQTFRIRTGGAALIFLLGAAGATAGSVAAATGAGIAVTITVGALWIRGYRLASSPLVPEDELAAGLLLGGRKRFVGVFVLSGVLASITLAVFVTLGARWNASVLTWLGAALLAYVTRVTLRDRSVVGPVMIYGYLALGVAAALFYRPTAASYYGSNPGIAFLAAATPGYRYLELFTVVAFSVWVGFVTVGTHVDDRATRDRVAGLGLQATPKIALPAMALWLALVPLVLDVYGTGFHTVLHASTYLERTGPSVAFKIGRATGAIGVFIAGHIFFRARGINLKFLAMLIGLGYAALYLATDTRFFGLVVPMFALGGLLAGNWNARQRTVAVIISGAAALLMIQIPLALRGLPNHGLVASITYIRQDPRLLLADPFNDLLFGAPLSLYVAHNVPSLPSHDIVTSLSPLPSSLTDWARIAPTLRLNQFTPYSALGQLLNAGWWYLILIMGAFGAAYALLERTVKRSALPGLGVLILSSVAALSVLRSTQYDLRTFARLGYYVAVLTILLLLATVARERPPADVPSAAR